MQEHTGDKMLDILKSNEGQAFTITQLSQQLGVSRVSARNHAKRLSEVAAGQSISEGHENVTPNETQYVSESSVHISKGPGEPDGAGIVVWYGGENYQNIYLNYQPQSS